MACRECGRPVPASRRFCACGATVVRPDAGRSDLPPRAPSMIAEWAGHRSFRRSMRVASGGMAPAFDGPTAARVVVTRVVVVLLVLGAVGSQVGPWGTEFRRVVAERVDAVRTGTALPGVVRVGSAREQVHHVLDVAEVVEHVVGTRGGQLG
jgi:hypothetical protein